MPDFVCTVCSSTFSLPDEVLAKYPNWVPKYCRKHSPKKNASAPAPARASAAPHVVQGEDLTLEEVLATCTGGPDTGIFTDGSARPNPGPGGWGVVRVKNGELVEQRYGRCDSTTNNRMELSALIEAFKMLDSDAAEVIYSDSDLCVKTLTQWAKGWESRGWKRKTGPIENLDLVREAYDLYRARPKVELQWVKAHNGGRWNEYANSLASAWARERL